MNGKRLAVAVAISMALSVWPAWATSVDTIVAGLYPPRLAEETQQQVAEGARPRSRNQTWAPLAADDHVIVAAYSDEVFSDIRVLRIQNGQGALLWEPPDLLYGDAPEIRVMDLNGDGQQDFVVIFETNQGRSFVSRFYLFDGEAVTCVTGPDGIPGYARFVDIEGDGVVDVVSGQEDLDGNDQTFLYRLTEGGYDEAAQVVYSGTNGRGRGAKPIPKTEHFLSGEASATLLLLNGFSGWPRSAAVEVYLNGEKVISRKQLNENTDHVSVPVTLLTGDPANTITSTVYGKPDAAIRLLICVESADCQKRP